MIEVGKDKGKLKSSDSVTLSICRNKVQHITQKIIASLPVVLESIAGICILKPPNNFNIEYPSPKIAIYKQFLLSTREISECLNKRNKW